MASNGSAQLAEKDSYTALTPKQQRVVDELVKDPTAENTKIADRADVSRATVYNVKDHYDHIVEAKLNETGRYPGEEKTEGDPYDLLEEEIAPQRIKDRPHQPSKNGEDDTEAQAQAQAQADSREGHTTDPADVQEELPKTDNGLVTVRLDKVQIRDVLENRECAHVRGAVVDALIDQAFEPAKASH